MIDKIYFVFRVSKVKQTLNNFNYVTFVKCKCCYNFKKMQPYSCRKGKAYI